MEGATLSPAPEANSDKISSIGEKKSRQTRRRSVVIGAAATKSAERAESLPRWPAVEAHQIHGHRKAEHLGHAVVSGEAGENHAIDDKSELPEQVVQKHLETLNRPELLELSDKIMVDGSSLRQIYETHLVGEHGLRRLIAEHLRGGDLKKALRREITEREIDFERDPAMRDIGAVINQASTQMVSHSQAALDRMLEKAVAAIPAANQSEETAFYKALANYEAKQYDSHLRRRQIIDISLVSGVVLLLAVSLIVYLVRR